MFDEAILLRAADAYEHATGWWKEEPVLRAAESRLS
jgi:hypothetical protein